MTDIVAKPGVLFPAASVLRSVTVPDLTGLFAEYWFGVDGPTSKKNRASGGSDLIDLSGAGAPTYSSNYMTVTAGGTLGASTGLDSTIVAPNAVTIMVLQRQAAQVATQNKLRSFGTDNTGIGGTAANNNWSFWNGFNGASTDQGTVPYGTIDTNFHIVGGVGIIGQVGRAYLYSGGVATTDDGTRTDTARGSTTFKAGGFIANSLQGQADIAGAWVFNVAKTAAQMDALAASIKSWGTARGLTVS